MIKYFLLFLLCYASSFAYQYSQQEIALMQNIRCPVCSGQSIYDSNNEVSFKMRNIVTQMFAQHKSSSEIEAVFREKFGDDIIIDRVDKYHYSLYLVPIITSLLIALGWIVTRIYRKNSRNNRK